jgi:hypothetical protein
VSSIAATSCNTCAAGKFTSTLGSISCGECRVGYYCKAGSSSATEYNCANATDQHPANHYCPAGSGSPLPVPLGYFSEPDSVAYLYNRQSLRRCNKFKRCEKGTQTSIFIWKSGDCHDGADYTQTVGKAIVSVDEASRYILVGGTQRVEAPFPVSFSLSAESVSYGFGLNTNVSGLYYDAQVPNLDPTSPLEKFLPMINVVE